MKVKSEVAQSCPTLRDPMDYSPPGSSIHEISQARVLEWGATAFSKKKKNIYIYVYTHVNVYIHIYAHMEDTSCVAPSHPGSQSPYRHFQIGRSVTLSPVLKFPYMCASAVMHLFEAHKMQKCFQVQLMSNQTEARVHPCPGTSWVSGHSKMLLAAGTTQVEGEE